MPLAFLNTFINGVLHMIIQEIAEQFRTELVLMGYEVIDPIVIDGEFHRFSTKPGVPNDTAGWYVLHQSPGYVAGAYGDHRTGANEKWRSGKGKRLTRKKRRALAIEIKEKQKEREAVTAFEQGQAAKLAVRAWNSAHTNVNHQYLRDKNIRPYGIRQRTHNGQEELAIPIGDQDGMTSTQFILEDGTKLFRTNGRVKGCYHLISEGKPLDQLYICEGYSTGATLYEQTGVSVFVAFNSGNLEPVARVVRKQYPEAHINIAADNDQWTPKNPGKKAGQKAALAVKAALTFPDFTGLDTSGHPTDFNDFIALGGAI
jgi:putative DNA primase/helicase